jgi:hypothetical protein
MEYYPTRLCFTPRRLDLAVKVMFFANLALDAYEHAERIYRWHILKRREYNATFGLGTDSLKPEVDDYVTKSTELFMSMKEHGFVKENAITLDPNGELKNGVHRVACAFVVGVDEIPIIRSEYHAWAPPWSYEWFKANEMPLEDLKFLGLYWRKINVLGEF